MSTQITQNDLPEGAPDPITGEPGRERGGASLQESRKENPISEAEYWQAHHADQPFAQSEEIQEHYQRAYEVGYEGFSTLAGLMRTFEEAEAALRSRYEASAPTLSWDRGRLAARAAWERLSRQVDAEMAEAKKESEPSLDIPPNIIMATAPQAAEVPMSTPAPRS